MKRAMIGVAVVAMAVPGLLVAVFGDDEVVGAGRLRGDADGSARLSSSSLASPGFASMDEVLEDRALPDVAPAPFMPDRLALASRKPVSRGTKVRMPAPRRNGLRASELAGPAAPVSDVAEVSPGSSTDDLLAGVVPIGDSAIVFDTGQNAPAALAEAGKPDEPVTGPTPNPEAPSVTEPAGPVTVSDGTGEVAALVDDLIDVEDVTALHACAGEFLPEPDTQSADAAVLQLPHPLFGGTANR